MFGGALRYIVPSRHALSRSEVQTNTAADRNSNRQFVHQYLKSSCAAACCSIALYVRRMEATSDDPFQESETRAPAVVGMIAVPGLQKHISSHA